MSLAEQNCRLCGNAINTIHSEPDFALYNIPQGAQFLPTREQLGSDKGTSIRVVACRACGHVQLQGEPLVYHDEATSATAYSEAMLNHRREQAEEFVSRFHLQGKKVLEVGCGDGHFLALLSDLGAIPTGIDPAPRAIGIGHQKGLSIQRGYVTGESQISGGPYDAFVTFHVLEHVPDPNDFFRGIHANLSENAVGMIEVPSLEQLVEGGRFYDVLVDHLSYFSTRALRMVLELNGFDVLEVRRDWNGEHDIAIVRKRTRTGLETLRQSMEQITAVLNNLVSCQIDQGKRVAFWGASHHAITLLATTGVQGIEYVVDSTPYKQGRFMPVSHYPIVAPDKLRTDPVDVLVVTAPRYQDEIIGQIREEIKFTGKLLLLQGDRLETIQEG